MKNYFEIKLLYKESDYREEIDVMEEVINRPTRATLDKYHTWQYRKYFQFSLAGNRTGKSRVLL